MWTSATLSVQWMSVPISSEATLVVVPSCSMTTADLTNTTMSSSVGDSRQQRRHRGEDEAHGLATIMNNQGPKSLAYNRRSAHR